MLSAPFFPAASAGAASDLQYKTTITINYPPRGTIITSSSVQISVSYLWEAYSYEPPSPTNKWGVSIRCYLYQSFDRSLDENDYAPFEYRGDVTSTSGSAALNVNLANYPAGLYEVSADLLGPVYGTTNLGSWTSDESGFQYGSANPTSRASEEPEPTPGNQQQDNNSSSTGAVVGGVVGAGAIGGLIYIIRKMMGGKKPPQKTVVKTSGGGNKTTPPAQKTRPQSNKAIADAADALSKAKKNAALFDRWTLIRNSVAGDSNLSDFVDKARNSIVGKDGQINEANLNRLQFLLKNWIKRDKLGTQLPDYTSSDAFADTVQQASGSITIRLGAAYLTGGYSEMLLNPVSALSTMRQGIMAGQSTLRAVATGYASSGLQLAIGESGRLLNYASPYLQQQYNTAMLKQLNPNLASEVSTVSQLAGQTEGQMTRSAFMKGTEVTQLGKTAGYELNSAEQAALQLNNNPAYRQLMADNHQLIPADVKNVIGTAKQKVYEQARNNAIGDTLNQMGKDGVNVEGGQYFIKQTGTHARPGNPGWNSVKSDFDHTVDFGSSEYNQLYEQNFNANLQNMGTSAKAVDANVYGAGTSSRGAYTGGATKYVQTYNEATGSDIMVRSKDGLVTVSREEPQTITSLASRMKPDDIPSAKENFQNFFQKDIAKGGTLNSQIEGGSKTVSRMNEVNRADNILQTGKVSNFETPQAAKVANLIKNKGYTVDNAMQKVGYEGSKSDLLNDYKKFMGL